MDNFFVRRPIVAMVLSILMVIMGVLALQKTPVAQYPEIAPPMVSISTAFRGASAVNVEQAVTTPLEQKVNGVENMLYMTSINASDGSMSLRVTFEVGTDLDNATMLTTNRVGQATPFLPQEVRNNGITTKKTTPFPLMLISLTSPKGTYGSNFLSNYCTINLVDPLSRLDGVGEIRMFGGSDYAMRIWVKPDMLAKLNLSVSDLVNAVKEQNIISPGGQFGGPPAPSGTEFTYTTTLRDRLVTEEEFGNIIVKSSAEGEQVRLRDVARIELGLENYATQANFNGKDGAVIVVYQAPGSNALQLAEDIKARVAEMSERFPEDIRADVSLDTTLAVTAGIDEIMHTLLEAVVLVIIVVFLFLQSWRATLIPLLTVPVSLIGVFILFPLIGFSVNVLSLLGLVLAIGIVVDDAIVVVEAVMHNVEHGMNPREATVKAMKEVSGPVIAIALILVAVFIPVALAPGITGRMYQQFALTIAISVIISAINALTLSPALSSLLIKPNQQTGGALGRFFKGFNNVFSRFTDKYTSFTAIVIRKTGRAFIFILILVAGIVVLGKKIPGGFVPEEDQGYMMLNIQLPDASSLERTDSVCKKVSKVLANTPEIQSYTTILGYSMLSSAVSANNAFIFISLKEWSERELTANQLAQKLNSKMMTGITDATVIAFGPPAIQGLGNAAGFTIMLEDREGQTPEFLAVQTKKFMEAAKKHPEIGRISTTFRANVPQLRLDVDRDKAIKLNVALNEVYTSVNAYLGGMYINDIIRFGRQFKVLIQSEKEYRARVEDLNRYFVKSRDGKMIPLATLVSVGPMYGPEFTNRFNLYRAAEVSGTPAPGFSSSEAMKALEATAKEVLPRSMAYDFSNMSFQEKEAEGKGGTVFLMALVFVFLILAAQYESWSLPFSVLLGTPFAVFGAFLGLWIMGMVAPGYENNVFAQIGLVMLIGLAAKNAILIVEFAKAEYEKGTELVEAALLAAKLRFRPILMTAFAFILGVVPLLTATGAGAEARKVIGITVFSGMLVATILGVIMVPMFFIMIEKLGKKKHQSAKGKEEAV
jgi:HAE1 family hydrophobic/amphiphilic exporter-1